MPRCGYQVMSCDIPIRIDSYFGCGFNCQYCYARRKRHVNNRNMISIKERRKSVLNFIRGERTSDTNWCDWDIPLRWGVMSDPFQYCDKEYRVSQDILTLFSNTGYPVVIVSKSDLLIQQPYKSLLKDTNSIIQISLCSPIYEKVEHAPSYKKRFHVLKELVPIVKRVLVRIQPYIPSIKPFIINEALKLYKDIGVYGVILESIRIREREQLKGLPLDISDMVYGTNYYNVPKAQLENDYIELRDATHYVGLKFYCSEDLLRNLSDEPCCCGCGDLFRINKSNFNYKNRNYTKLMLSSGTAGVFRNFNYSQEWNQYCKNNSYKTVLNTIKQQHIKQV